MKRRYSIFEAVGAAIAAANRAVELVHALAQRPGIPGRDGMGFDDLQLAFDGERTVTFCLARGPDKKEWSFTFPSMIYRGVWREGQYAAGDAVTFGGSLFIAGKATSGKPETTSDWQLAVKRGRDGKDGKPTVDKGPQPVKLG